MRRENVVNDLKAIARTLPPDVTAILYGSEARGEARPDSDFDILILVDRDELSYDDELNLKEPFYSYDLQSGHMISPVVYLRKNWYNPAYHSPFKVNVNNEGIVL